MISAQMVTANREPQNKYKALIYGAQLGCITASVLQAVILAVLAVPEIIKGNVIDVIFFPVLYLLYGLLVGGVFVNLFLWLILLPLYGRSAKSLSLKQAVGFALIAGPIYVILLVATLTPQKFRFDIESIATYSGIGMLYGVCVAYWCVRLEQQFARKTLVEAELV